jgi:hypothetical protein
MPLRTPQPLPTVPFRGLRTGLLLPLACAASVALAQTDTTLTVPIDTTEQNLDQRAAAYTISASELDAELSSQDVSGVLQSSRDVFNSTAGFTFGAARFRIRGFDGENTLVSLNGALVNDLETGFASFTNWGGLNDVTRWLETRTGITASRYNFGSVNGYTEIGLRASELRRGTRFSYALTNRAYTHRLMGTYNTGMLANGWAFSVSGSRRWAEEGYIPGTSYDAGAYFVSAEKRINARHSIAFTGMGAPIRQGRQTLAVQEAMDLVGDNYYNPSWGYQAGEKRNARISFDHKPILLLTHIAKPDDSTEWTTTALYSFGRDGNTNLNWYDAKDPRPDYYRYLPSYYYNSGQPGIGDDLSAAWQSDVNTQQINWDQLWFANSKNLYTVEDVNGVLGRDTTGMRSKYIVEDQRTDPTRLALNTVWSRAMRAGYHLTAGASWNKQKTHNYKVLNDLLGGDFWLDLNQFAELDVDDPNGSQQNLDTPNRVVGEGDTFGYDFDIHTRLINAFAQAEKQWGRLEGYVGITASQTTFWRDGRYVNGLFPNDSKGESERYSFTNGGLKAGAVYKINGRNYITANAAWLTRAPSPRTAFISPRTRGTAIGGLTDEQVFGGDISYLARMPRLKGRATLYYNRINDQLWSRSFFHEEFLTLVNYTMTGVDQTHMGLELGVEAKLSPTWTATGVLALGDYRYSSRPSATITRDNLDTAVAGRTVYWKNYRVGGMPQTCASIGANYSSPKFWRAGANINWFGDIYLDPNPDRRTNEALTNLVTDDPQWDQLLDQTKLDDGMTLDLFFFKSWMFQRKYRLGFNVSVNNVLDNTTLRTGGFEQLRFDQQNPDKFPPKYGYMFGRTFFVMLTFSF